MRFVTAEYENSQFVGIINENGTHVLNVTKAEETRSGESNIPGSMIECIKQGDVFINKISTLLKWIDQQTDKRPYNMSIEEIKLLAPIPRPAKNIICVGKNYAEHAIEMGSADDIPEHIMVFTKAPTTVIGNYEAIMNHQNVTSELDYEGELAIIIGKEGRSIAKEDALDHVFGYTIVNDVTARDLQVKHKQFFIGKSLDTTCPLGPWIVHHSEIKDPNHLNIQTYVNGELRQDSNTQNFIFTLEEIISVLSRGMTLEPGDIIATGTPAGVGKGFKPPRYLKSGDEIEIRIEKIGVLKNKIQ
jgi:2-keto-4-pentenoate hydratase/2-oxohepta-3-ene-1,7-dioic acid hydratase in catechol pathway